MTTRDLDMITRDFDMIIEKSVEMTSQVLISKIHSQFRPMRKQTVSSMYNKNNYWMRLIQDITSRIVKVEVKVINQSRRQRLITLRRKANARNVSFRISLRWPTHIINPVDKTKLSRHTSHRRSTTVSLETYPSVHKADNPYRDLYHSEYHKNLIINCFIIH